MQLPALVQMCILPAFTILLNLALRELCRFNLTFLYPFIHSARFRRSCFIVQPFLSLSKYDLKKVNLVPSLSLSTYVYNKVVGEFRGIKGGGRILAGVGFHQPLGTCQSCIRGAQGVVDACMRVLEPEKRTLCAGGPAGRGLTLDEWR